MEAIIFCGIQASGKTTFYVEHFLKTHVRISMDLLHTRRKEQHFLHACLEMQQRFVVDNTNPSPEERAVYISAAKAKKFRVKGYYFQSDLAPSLLRNAARTGKEHIPERVSGQRFTG